MKSNQKNTGTYFIKWLAEIDKNDIGLVGGKAAVLGELTKLGLPVPKGFCLTINGYKHFFGLYNLGKEIREITPSILGNYKQLKICSERIRNSIHQKGIPPNIQKEIRFAYDILKKELGDNLSIAVRSSATAEDQKGTSFAGQFESFLNVKEIDETIKKVKQCWSALYNPSVLTYIHKNKLAIDKISVAVIIQQMIDAQESGVMFTMNPITKNCEEILIEGSWGLAQGIVSGTVTPDLYTIAKKNLDVKDIQISQKEHMIVPDILAGVTKIKVPNNKITAQCLGNEKLNNLARIGKIIENYFGYPQDIEWCIKNKTVFILQARPITT